MLVERLVTGDSVKRGVIRGEMGRNGKIGLENGECDVSSLLSGAS